MNLKHGICGLILGAVVAAAGCDKKPEQPKAGEGNHEQYKAAMDRSMKEQQVAAQKAMEQMRARMTPATQQAATAASDAAAAVGAGISAAGADLKAQGSDLLGKLESAVKENRLNEAQTYVDGFERIKANVPDDLKVRYEALKDQVAAAKAKVTTPAPTPAAPPAEPNK